MPKAHEAAVKEEAVIEQITPEAPVTDDIADVQEKLQIATDFLFWLTRSQEMAQNWPLRQKVIQTLRRMGAWNQ